MREEDAGWSIEVWEDPRTGRSPFERWFAKLSEYDQIVVDAVIRNVVARHGIDVCSTEWGKPLGAGLYEIRIRRSLHAILTGGRPDTPPAENPRDNTRVLLRLFVTFHGDRAVLLFQGYDKGKDPSKRRQEREIRTARKHLRAWKNSR